MNKNLVLIFMVMGITFVVFVLYNTYKRATSPQYMLDTNKQKEIEQKLSENKYHRVVFAGGCFWCTEGEFNHEAGIISAISGYADSDKPNPSYEEVGNHTVRAREAVEVIYDPSLITFDTLLEKYWTHIDPSDTGGQFGDRGYSYTTAIYYTNDEQRILAEESKKRIEDSKKFTDNDGKVATQILAFTNFYPAEEYHQDYKDNNPIRYNGYREASGRNNFIRLHWKDGSTTTSPIFVSQIDESEKDSDNSTTTKSTNENKSEAKSWLTFDDKSKQDRLKSLTSLQYDVTQREKTEPPFDNAYDKNKEAGIYVDIVSGEPLYLSKDKFDSGTGWPSFVRPIDESFLTLKTDNYLIYSRTEVRSKIADSHLGHVFDDGPADRGGKRYCMNSASLRFVPVADMEKEGYGEYVNLLK